MNNPILISILLLSLVSLAPYAHSYTAQESNGIVTLETPENGGFRVKEVKNRWVKKSKKEWMYVCLEEVSSSQSNVHRCFYFAARKKFSLKSGQKLRKVGYRIRKNFFNSGQISMGKNRHFYQLVSVQ